MGQPHEILQYYSFGPLEQRGTELTRGPNVASSLLNCDFIEGDVTTSVLTQRLGSKARGDNAGNGGGFGLFTYNKQSSDGSVTVERLVVGSKLFRLQDGSLEITYSGAGSSVALSILVDEATSTWKCSIEVDGAEVYSKDLGVGFDELSTVTISDLSTEIDALADFSTVLTGTGTVPAAFLPSMWLETFVSNVLTIPFIYNEQVFQPDGAQDPFFGLNAKRNDPMFRNISSVEKANCRFFASIWDEQMKYDGQNVYRSGLPKPSTPTTAAGGAGNPNGDYQHFITYLQKDAVNNENWGARSELSTLLTVTNDAINVTVANIQNTTGFNTNQGIVNGNQAGVTTINLSANSLQVGDTAYFLDRATSTYVERLITGRTGTSITFAGAVDVNNTDVISNNLRIQIWRNSNGSTLWQLVAEIPNNSAAATQVFNDNVADASLGEFYDDQEALGTERGLPPKVAYLSTYKNSLVGIQKSGQLNTIQVSEPGNPEWWPEIYQFPVNSATNEPLTGGAPAGAFFFIFKSTEMHRLTGDPTTGQFSIDKEAGGIGCSSHATIQEKEKDLLWADDKGVYLSEYGAPAVRISDAVYQYFFKKHRQSDKKPKMERAVAVVDQTNDRYILFVPTESANGSDVYANADSFCLIYDAFRSDPEQGQYTWLAWNGMNMAGGAVFVDDDLYFVERRFSTVTSTMAYLIYQRLNSATDYDYVDHVDPIEWRYVPGWEAFGRHSILKDFNKFKAYSVHPEFSGQFTLDFKTEVNLIPSVFNDDTQLEFGMSSGTGFGTAPFGDASFGDPSDDNIVEYELNRVSVKSFRPVFEHSAIYKRVLLTGWELEAVTSYKPAMTG